MGRSKAQDALMKLIASSYETSYVTDEVYIGELISQRGYTMKEMARELGHTPHRMFVDIVMRDSDSTIAFEYHGEQHYKTIGKMTETRADLLVNQQLDREKSWILDRIGIPLIQVPYDAYVDSDVLFKMIDDAIAENEESLSKMTECLSCGRLFPESMLANGICRTCSNNRNSHIDRAESKYPAQNRNGNVDDRDWDGEKTKKTKDDSKLGDREKRKRAYERYKRSPEFEIMREKQKAARKAAYERYKRSPEYERMKKQRKRERKAIYEKYKRDNDKNENTHDE